MIMPFLLALGLYSLASVLRLVVVVRSYALQTSSVAVNLPAPSTAPDRSERLS